MRSPHRQIIQLLSLLLVLAGSVVAAQNAADESGELAQMRQQMIDEVYDYKLTGDADYDYAALTINLNESALEMSHWMLDHTEDERLRSLAQETIGAQEDALERLRNWFDRYPQPKPADDVTAVVDAYEAVFERMAANAEELDQSSNPEIAYVDALIWHHEMIYSLSQNLVQQSVDAQLRLIATDVSRRSSRQVANLSNWRARQ